MRKRGKLSRMAVLWLVGSWVAEARVLIALVPRGWVGSEANCQLPRSGSTSAGGQE